MFGRLLIIDEDLPKRLAWLLAKRGRNVTSNSRLGWTGHKDHAFLPDLARDYPHAALVTGDIHMPAAHSEILATLPNVTLAIVHKFARPPEFKVDEWEWEVVDRWAHRMEAQLEGTYAVYGLKVGRWTEGLVRRRHG
jgi:hypothetical protein